MDQSHSSHSVAFSASATPTSPFPFFKGGHTPDLPELQEKPAGAADRSTVRVKCVCAPFTPRSVSQAHRALTSHAKGEQKGRKLARCPAPLSLITSAAAI